MPVRVDAILCDGCLELAEKRCEAVCPGDLMTVDPQTLRAFCRERADCWDCYSCVKACPRGAVTPRLAYEIALYGVKVGYESAGEGGRWTFSSGDGEEEVFET